MVLYGDFRTNWGAELRTGSGALVAECEVVYLINIICNDPVEIELAHIVAGHDTVTRAGDPLWFKVFHEDFERNYERLVEKAREYLEA